MGLFGKKDKGEDGAQLALLRRLAREDLVELGERLEDEAPPVETGALAEREIARTLTAQSRPRLRDADTTAAVLEVQATICEAFVHLARADAVVRGEEPPTRTDPCDFNPQHGPAVTEATWAPIGGTPATYACCQPDADLIAAGRAPRRRTIKLDVGDVAWDELGSARRTPGEMARRHAATDYDAISLAATKFARTGGRP